MGVPKLTLSVKLINDNEVKIKLLHVTNVFTEKKNAIITDNQWTIKSGNQFAINMYAGVITFPKKPNHDKDITDLWFSNDKIREILLRDLSNALLLWTNDKIFDDEKIFSDEPCLRYHKKLWIIY